MPVAADFNASLICPPFGEIAAELRRKGRKPHVMCLALRNEIAPSDLYCYLHARFGPPNGPQDFFRKDSSDNLVHWEWMLRAGTGWIQVAPAWRWSDDSVTDPGP